MKSETRAMMWILVLIMMVVACADSFSADTATYVITIELTAEGMRNAAEGAAMVIQPVMTPVGINADESIRYGRAHTPGEHLNGVIRQFIFNNLIETNVKAEATAPADCITVRIETVQPEAPKEAVTVPVPDPPDTEDLPDTGTQ